jgi:hypothetical protein
VRLFFVLIASGWMACSHTAIARQVLWSCDTISDMSGHREHQDIAIDTEDRTVLDNSMTWKNDARSQTGGAQSNFVQSHDQTIAWGDRLTSNGSPTVILMLDEQSGLFSMTFVGVRQLMHGACFTPKPVA